MPSEPSAELWMLRAKAYGPGGQLSADELARLEDLEGRGGVREDDARQDGGAIQGDGVDGGSLSEHSETKRAEQAERIDASTAPSPDASTAPPSAPDTSTGPVISDDDSKRRRRWPKFIGAATALLAIGLGVGWGIWGWDSEAVALAAAHGDTLSELEAQEMYDPGTIVPLSEQYGVVIWRADRSEGDERCVIITNPRTEEDPSAEDGPRKRDNPQTGCVTKEQITDSGWPSAMSTVPDGQEKAGQQLIAGLIPTVSGELVPYVQVWDPDRAGWESQYDENELTQLHALESAGYDAPTLSILGYDGDVVIWSTWGAGGLCVIAPTDDDGDGFAEACAEDPESIISLDVHSGGFSTHYVVTQSDRRSPQLTIYKGADVDYYFGAGDDPQFDDFFGDDPAIDDKTGE